MTTSPVFVVIVIRAAAHAHDALSVILVIQRLQTGWLDGCGTQLYGTHLTMVGIAGTSIIPAHRCGEYIRTCYPSGNETIKTYPKVRWKSVRKVGFRGQEMGFLVVAWCQAKEGRGISQRQVTKTRQCLLQNEPVCHGRSHHLVSDEGVANLGRKKRTRRDFPQCFLVYGCT